jgi:hypothetical protein
MKIKLLTLFILATLLLSSCGPKTTQQAPFPPGSQVWIDTPLPGSILPMEAVEFVAHASNPGGVNSFEFILNGQSVAQTQPDPSSQDPTFGFTRYTWNPVSPGTYLLEAISYDANNTPSAPAQTRFIIRSEGTNTPTNTPTETPTITPTPTETFTPSPSPTCGPLTFTPNLSLNCREGPGEVFNPLENPAMKGQAYLLDGQNEEGSWYRIMLKSTIGCWVAANLGTTSCDTRGLRVLEAIPTPTTAVLCPSFTDQASCEANDGCEWKFSSMGPARCMNK